MFYARLLEMMEHLARLIVSDGEGSSKFVQYTVTGAPGEEHARVMARGISKSISGENRHVWSRPKLGPDYLRCRQRGRAV